MEKITKKIVFKENTNIRLDLYLKDYLNLKRAIVQKNISLGNVLLNGKECKNNSILKLDDVIDLNSFITSFKKELAPVKKNLDIIFENDDFAIINKEKGLVVYPGVGNEEDSLVERLLARYGKDSLSNGLSDRPGIVHRLDKDTSGLIIICKNDEYYNFLKEAFKKRLVKKGYYAILSGTPKILSQRLCDSIKKSSKNPIKKEVSPLGKEAILDYLIVKKGIESSLAKINLITGRTHQIRVQMSNLGYPLLGDMLYQNMKKYKSQGFFLHSYMIEFLDYKENKLMHFEVDMPEYFKKITDNMENV